MRVLMFGWEFPPHKSGGLGTACYDLTKGLAKQGVEITFVMPSAPENSDADFVKLLGISKWKDKVKFTRVESTLRAYQTVETYNGMMQEVQFADKDTKSLYGKNLYAEVQRFAEIAKHIAKEEPHDIIHVHDWMTYQAGINAQKVSGKPLIAHIHATEFDRTADNPDRRISEIEFAGMSQATRVIANSNLLKNKVLENYKINKEKIKVVHWGIEPDKREYSLNTQSPWKKEPVVLFLGRVTVQKGPDYFIEVAKRVLDFMPNAKFIMAGNGDMLGKMIDRATQLGIADRVIFTGMLKGEEVHKAFQLASVYVMPSVSEPFGLVALEALKNKCPIIISKQSGVSEVVKNAIKVDFWDINKISNAIVSGLKHPEVFDELRENSFNEVSKFNLDTPATKVIKIYKEVLK